MVTQAKQLHFEQKKLSFYQFTSIGDRESNQDYMDYVINTDYALFVVADGLGGHQGGERASSFFCKGMLKLASRFTQLIAKEPVTVFCAWIDEAVDEMARLFDGDETAAKAFTTCTILYIQGDIVLTAHCGDSRIYRMQPEKVLWRTKDHSVPQLLLDKGEIREQEMGAHPDQNRLTRSINVNKIYAPEVKIHPALQSGETFVLCTDGFWGHTKQRELLHLARPECEKEDLIKQVKTAYLRAEGNSDNLSLQWVRVA